jgi:hypothetical protein
MFQQLSGIRSRHTLEEAAFTLKRGLPRGPIVQKYPYCLADTLRVAYCRSLEVSDASSR